MNALAHGAQHRPPRSADRCAFSTRANAQHCGSSNRFRRGGAERQRRRRRREAAAERRVAIRRCVVHHEQVHARGARGGGVHAVPARRPGADPRQQADPLRPQLRVPDGALGPRAALLLDDVHAARARVRRGEAAAARGRHGLLLPVEPRARRRVHGVDARLRQRRLPLPARRLHPNAQSVHADGDAALPLALVDRDAVGRRRRMRHRDLRRHDHRLRRRRRRRRLLARRRRRHVFGRSDRGAQARPSAEATAEPQVWGAQHARANPALPRPPTRPHARARRCQRGRRSFGSARDARGDPRAESPRRALPYACIPVFP